jgi:hypothetical protein
MNTHLPHRKEGSRSDVVVLLLLPHLVAATATAAGIVAAVLAAAATAGMLQGSLGIAMQMILLQQLLMSHEYAAVTEW